jgi:Domain of unknown function (DUF4352)
MNSRPIDASSSSVAAAVGAVMAVVAATAVLGAVLAAHVLAGDRPPNHHDAAAAGPFRVAQDIPTSFGFVAVEHAEQVKGLTAKALGGATHGIGSFVGRDRSLVQASITLTNTRLEPVQYEPSQFRLVARRAGTVTRHALSHATVRPGTLQPDADVDARLSFVAPRDGSDLSIEFTDPARRAPIVIDLGRRTGRATGADRRAAQSHGGDHNEDHTH